MLSGCYGLPIRTFTAFLLWINVIVNLYNMILISFNSHNPELVKFLGTHIIYDWWLILIQTILMLCAIIFIDKKSTTRGIIFAKFWSFGLTVVFLVLEIQVIISFMIFIYQHNSVDKYWKNIKHDTKESSPVHLYITVIMASLCFLAFKSYSAAVMFHFGDVFANYLSETGHDIGSDTDQVTYRSRDQIVSISLSPPPYDSSSAELGIRSTDLTSSPPPRYVDVFNY